MNIINAKKLELAEGFTFGYIFEYSTIPYILKL